MDIWVRATPENAQLVWQALVRFGAPLDQLSLEDLSTPAITYQIGIVPNRIDILTQISGVTFDEAWPNRLLVEHDGLQYGVIGKAELIRNKVAAGRSKDLVDVENLKRQ